MADRHDWSCSRSDGRWGLSAPLKRPEVRYKPAVGPFAALLAGKDASIHEDREAVGDGRLRRSDRISQLAYAGLAPSSAETSDIRSCGAEFVWFGVPSEVFVVEDVWVRRQPWRMPTGRLARVRRPDASPRAQRASGSGLRESHGPPTFVRLETDNGAGVQAPNLVCRCSRARQYKLSASTPDDFSI
jgi:hypothetical protein